MKLAIAFAILLLALPAAAALPPTVKLPDGITALITSVHSIGGEVITHNAENDFEFDISIFEKLGEEWTQVGRYATLRIVVYNDIDREHDVVSKGFRANATAPVRVSAPADVTFPGRPMDIWVTIYKEDESYPTSHYSVQKNALLEAGQYDAADAFDYHHVLNPISG